MRKSKHALLMLGFLLVLPNVVRAQPWGYGHCLPLDGVYTFEDERNAFFSMAFTWGYNDFDFRALASPNNVGSTPAVGFSELDWFSKHTGARFVYLDTHGQELGPGIEAFDDSVSVWARYDNLIAGGWVGGDPETDPNTEIFVGEIFTSSNPIWFINVTAIGISNSMPHMEDAFSQFFIRGMRIDDGR